MKDEEISLIKKSGENLANVVSETSFELWQTEEFKQMVNFDKISQLEQNRIFNELLLTALGLFFLHLDHVLKISQTKNQKQLFKLLQTELYKGFINMFVKLGIEQKFIDEWKYLVGIRIEEYRKNFKGTYEYSQDIKEMSNEKLKIIWCRVETMVISGVSHIRRGKFEEGDLLIASIRKWLIPVDMVFGQISSIIIHDTPCIPRGKIAES